MRTPPLNSLRIFDAAARHLNFRLAAEELNVTQGAVAQQVRRLESDLGLKLFHRQARGLALTEAGLDYSQPIRKALRLVEDATAKLYPENLRIRISVPPSFASKWLVPRLNSFTHAHPSIDVQALASEEIADFKTDAVDLAIRQGQPPFSKGLSAQLLAPLDLCAVCSPGYAEQTGQITRIADFTTRKLIDDSHNHWDVLLEDAGLKRSSHAMQFNQTALAMSAAANSQGIALVPQLLAEMELAQGTLVEIWRKTPADRRGYYIVYPNGQKANPARQAMIDWLLSEVG